MEKTISTFEELENVCKDLNIYEAAQLREAETAEISVVEFRAKVKSCHRLQERYSNEHSLLGKTFEKITTYALATIEENLRMGKIVACPTAGSCAIVPSVLVGVSEELNIPEEEQINALITAGEVGRIISNKVALAGAVAGCQAECGVASAMSAAALTQMRGGTVTQILNAAALAMKNLL